MCTLQLHLSSYQIQDGILYNIVEPTDGQSMYKTWVLKMRHGYFCRERLSGCILVQVNDLIMVVKPFPQIQQHGYCIPLLVFQKLALRSHKRRVRLRLLTYLSQLMCLNGCLLILHGKILII